MKKLLESKTLNLHNHEHPWLVKKLDANNAQIITKSKIEVKQYPWTLFKAPIIGNCHNNIRIMSKLKIQKIAEI